ncbi:MAG: CxxxxCH/CxxCH domain-containing protein [Deltaproteobacteria bacterium]|nr:MAG: CxxxxCH/CxxCH domain-containing protein [Deltaproteobacteria bacterium]
MRGKLRAALTLAMIAVLGVAGIPTSAEAGTQNYTTAGTFSWTAPAGVTSVTVQAWGGGGAGGQRTTIGACGGGGGGAYAESTVSVIPGNNYSVVVGAAGTSGAAPTNGGNSTFATTLVVAAGGSSVAQNTLAGAAGGTAAASTGTIKWSGGSGAAGTVGTYGGGGGGSAGPAVAGNAATNATGATAVASGGPGGNGKSGGQGAGTAPASGPGGGGGGAYRTTAATSIGGAGFAGKVTLTWVDPVCNRAATVNITTAPMGIFAENGSVNYNVDITNADDAGCANTTYTLARSDSSTKFTSSLPAATNSLAPGATQTVVLTVSELTALVGETTDTTVTASAAGHASGNDMVTTSYGGNWVDNNMLHNSNRFPSSTKWTAQGGWGKPNTKYGPITCETCHAKGTGNIKRVKKTLVAPDPSAQFPIQADPTPPAGGVTFLDARNGTSQFGDDSRADKSQSNMICEACHTFDASQNAGVKFHGYDMTVGGNPGHYNKSDCTDCHIHKEGFKPVVNSCGACHSDEMTQGAHAAHVQKKGGIIEDDLSDCIVCHGAAVASYTNTGGHANHQTGTVNFAAGIADGGVSPNQTCTAACHATAAGKAAQWSAASLACDACHGNPPADGGGSGTAHAKHIALGQTCATCHVSTPANTVHITDLNPGVDNEAALLSDMGVAVNDEANVVFSTWSDANNTCANAACHNPSADSHLADWDTSSSSCNLCHGNTAGADSMASGSHGAHVDNALVIGDNFACTSCHPSVVSNTHRDGTLQVNAGLNYNGETVIPSTAFGSCASLNCHYDPSGEDGVLAIQNTNDWGTPEAGECNFCHESPSANGDHQPHFSAGRVTKGMTCYTCHADTMFSAASNTRIKPGSKHLDGSRIDVAAGGNYNAVAVTLTYNAVPDPSSCTANCHQTGNPKVWEAVSSCEGCHGDLSYIGATHTAHINISGSIDADLTECSVCHGDVSGYTMSEGGNHQNNAIDLAAGISNTTCTSACHASTAGDGNWADANGLNCDACHGYPPAGDNHTKHIAAGMTCSACHGAGDAAGTHPLTHNTAKDIDISGITTQGEALQSRGKDYLNPGGIAVLVDDAAYNAGVTTWNNSAVIDDAGNTCSNNLCHDPSANGNTVDWDEDVASCAMCHGDDAGAPITSGSHAQHVNASAKFGLTIACNDCHQNNAGNTKHFMTAGVPNAQVKFNGTKITTQYLGEVSLPNTGYGTCSTNACHNNGQGQAPVAAFTWGTVVATDCQFCHDDPPTSGKHVTHLGTAVNYGPYAGVASTACGDCHNANDDLTMTGRATHINGVVNFSDGNSVAISTATNDGIVVDAAVSSCNSCHGALAATANANAALAKAQWHNPGARLACESCHGNYTTANSKPDGSGVAAPFRAGTDYATKGHGKAGIAKACNDCHDSTVTHISAALGDANRLDPMGGKNFGVLAEQNDWCSNCHATTMYGHFANTKTPGGDSLDGLYCAVCHDPHGQGGQDAMIATSVNGQLVSGFTDRTQRSSYANGTFTGVCQVCHDQVEVSHFNTTTDSVATHKGTNNCLACHKHTDNPSFPPSGCSGCHGGGTSVGANSNYWPDSSNALVENTAGRHLKHMEQLALKKYGETLTQLLTDNTVANPGLSANDKQIVLCAYCHNMPGSDADHSQTLPAEVNTMANLWNGNVDNAVWTVGSNNGNCSNVNCHNNQATPAGFGWYGPNASACTMCHVAGNADNLPANNIHPNTGLHKVTNTSTVQAHNHTLIGPPGSTGCTSCHLSSANAPSTHIDGTAVADGPANTDRFLNSGAAAANSFVYTDGAANQASCGSTVGLIAGCHSDKGNWKRLWSKDADSTSTTGGTPRCTVCHGYADGAGGGWRDGITVVAHATLGQQLYTKHGVCETCHVAPAGDYNEYVYATKHEDGKIQINAGAVISPPDTGFIEAEGSCTNTCHSGVKKSMSKNTIVWPAELLRGTTASCNACHSEFGGGLKGDFAGLTLDSGGLSVAKHQVHIEVAGTKYADTANNSQPATYSFGCANCHPNNISHHVNGVIELTLNSSHGGQTKSLNNVAIDPVEYGNGTFNGANNWALNSGGITAAGGAGARALTCSAAYCHSNGKGSFNATPDWYGGAFAGTDPCAYCHQNSPAGSTHNLHNVGIHYNNVYTGGTGVVKDGSNRQNAHGVGTTSTTMSCNLCHWDTVQVKVNAKNAVCANCHSDTNTPATGNESISLANKAMHVNGAVNVRFQEVSVLSRAQLRPKSNTGVPDDVGATTNEVYENWKRQGGYKAAGAPTAWNSPSYDETWDTLGTNLTRPLDTATMYDSASKNCTVACHNMNEIGWGSTISKCSNCHTQLPK